MKMKILLAVFFLAIVAGCQMNSGDDIPNPYRQQLLDLRSSSFELQQKCADLQKQITENQAVINWNNTRIQQIAGQAMATSGHPEPEYIVDMAKLKIVRRKSMESKP